MGRLNRDQDQLFYAFNLDDAVRDDHMVRQIADVLDLSWLHATLKPHYSHTGRPSIDPELMLRMLIPEHPADALAQMRCSNTLNPNTAQACV